MSIINPVLIVSFIGYESQEIPIDQNTGFLNIDLTEADFLMGEVVIVRNNIFKRIGNLFRKKNKESCDSETHFSHHTTGN
ncbi:hypothetical protein [Aequorivita capsosiphonis]|uniref:hypothetical protein n=1 Tax=Aequorivita capsosiphonis TaxID=487317 RepID=UPI00047E0109|nr:hypothetical protein [Aequorivita capsosiphonis]